MNLDAVKVFIDQGSAIYERVYRLKSRTFWLVFFTVLIGWSATLLAMAEDAITATWCFFYTIIAIAIFAVKSIATSICETFEARSKDRLQSELARCEADVKIAQLTSPYPDRLEAE